MGNYFDDKAKVYTVIIDMLRKYKGIGKLELLNILKDNDCKYLFFLLIKKYNCFDINILKKDFPYMDRNKLENEMKKAEEKLLVNKKIRNMYFEAEDLIDKVK